MIEMKVEGLTVDPITNMPIIILKDLSGKRALPIWVGVFEANAIALEMERVCTPRPMTHDLIKNILDGINAQINHVMVSDLKDNTFYAEISVRLNNKDIKIDSRPSDAIAIALRADAPIFVTEKVITEAKSIDLTKKSSSSEGEDDNWKEWLENLKPEDFGNYEM